MSTHRVNRKDAATFWHAHVDNVGNLSLFEDPQVNICLIHSPQYRLESSTPTRCGCCEYQIRWKFYHPLLSVPPPPYVRPCPEKSPTNRGFFCSGCTDSLTARCPTLLLLSCTNVPPATPEPNGPHAVVPFPYYLSHSNTITVASGLCITHTPGRVAVISPVDVDATHGTRWNSTFSRTI